MLPSRLKFFPKPYFRILFPRTSVPPETWVPPTQGLFSPPPLRSSFCAWKHPRSRPDVLNARESRESGGGGGPYIVSCRGTTAVKFPFVGGAAVANGRLVHARPDVTFGAASAAGGRQCARRRRPGVNTPRRRRDCDARRRASVLTRTRRSPGLLLRRALSLALRSFLPPPPTTLPHTRTSTRQIIRRRRLKTNIPTIFNNNIVL